jgi:Na+-translocating ferredoxin:NAD+ oxidoreductase subunit G
MSQAKTLPAPGPQTSSAAMIRSLGLVATICGVLLVLTYENTLDAINANKRIALERAVFKVIPEAAGMKEWFASPAGLVAAGGAVPEGGLKFYAAYDRAGQLEGIAAEAGAIGYADMVRVLYAYNPAKQAIDGYGVVSHRETPGIGDKIIFDPAFLKNFVALDVRLNADKTALANPVKVVKHGSKQNPWEIDAISGATVTSRAVAKGINDSAGKLIPMLLPHLQQLQAGS